MTVTTAVKLGPTDHGRQMTLQEFARAEGEAGYLYELASGVIVVMDIPKLSHGRIVDALSTQIRVYQATHPGVIDYVAAGSDCALRLPGMQSERHPDQAIYLSPPPDPDDPWDHWVPDIVVEVVSEGEDAHRRDYQEKRQEYLAAGVREYWIVDPEKQVLLVLRRAGDVWEEKWLDRSAEYRTTLLPEFELKLESAFAGSR